MGWGTVNSTIEGNELCLNKNVKCEYHNIRDEPMVQYAEDLLQ